MPEKETARNSTAPPPEPGPWQANLNIKGYDFELWQHIHKTPALIPAIEAGIAAHVWES
jgi:hypothetical protein